MTAEPTPTRVIGYRVTCYQCPDTWWKSLVPSLVRPARWHPRRLDEIAATDHEQRVWGEKSLDHLTKLAESWDQGADAVQAEHKGHRRFRFHTPAVEMITEPVQPAAPAYGRPFEYDPVTRPMGRRMTDPELGAEIDLAHLKRGGEPA